MVKNENHPQTFGQRVLYLRENRIPPLSRRWLGELAKLSPRRIEAIEKGQAEPTLADAEALAKPLGLRPEELAGWLPVLPTEGAQGDTAASSSFREPTPDSPAQPEQSIEPHAGGNDANAAR